jgi:4-hydroxyphenylacetate 3-monooxygenase
MMHLARELCGGQICVTPDHVGFENAETKPWLEKYYTVNEAWGAEDVVVGSLRLPGIS